MTTAIKKTTITDAELTEAFMGLRFGDGTDYRSHVEEAMLKLLVGYHNGSGTTSALWRLGLIDADGNATEKGRMFVWETFRKKERG